MRTRGEQLKSAPLSRDGSVWRLMRLELQNPQTVKRIREIILHGIPLIFFSPLIMCPFNALRSFTVSLLKSQRLSTQISTSYHPRLLPLFPLSFLDLTPARDRERERQRVGEERRRGETFPYFAVSARNLGARD